jgi:flavodoxin
VAEQIAKILGADLDEIEDGKNRKGIRGFLGGGRDAFMKNQTQIEFEKNPADYDLVILGTPVWVGTATPAVRTYATQNREVLRNKQVAFFCTFGGEAKNTFADLEEFLRPPKATLDLKDKRVRAETKEVEKEIEEFCGKLK